MRAWLRRNDFTAVMISSLSFLYLRSWAGESVVLGISCFEVDDIAKKNFAFVEFITPDDDGLERERAFAQACDHRFAASLDALGNRDFALTRQQFHRTHFAQVHANRIVGALG